jgi:hypothetical protein
LEASGFPRRVFKGEKPADLPVQYGVTASAANSDLIIESAIRIGISRRNRWRI